MESCYVLVVIWLLIIATFFLMMIKFAAIYVKHTAFLLVFVNSLILGVYPETSLTVTNNCSFIVWPVVSVIDSPSSGAGFALQTGESRLFSKLSRWNIRLWGRTGCGESSDGKFICATGGCANRTLNCNGQNATESVTYAEFALNQPGLLDFYDISLVDGYNLPISVTPPGSNSCTEIGCSADLDRFCPPKLQALAGDGDIVACKGPCTVFRTNEYCCTNASDPCKPTNYSKVFKEACPSAYSYPLDDATSTFSCTRRAANNYTVTFCPSLTRIPGSPSSGQGTATSPSSGRRSSISIIAGVVSAIVLLVLVIGLIIWRKIKKDKRETNVLQELLTLEGHSETRGHKRNGAKNHDLQLFSYETILFATCNFSSDNKLGEGGFGTVYKGKTSEGQDLAVKLLSRQSGQGLLEFKTELILISKLQHVNLVKLHGLCIHGDDKMIIYDYMPNKSLDFFLFDPLKKEQLNWPRRFNIIEGIAQGLLYLHKYSRLKIIHRDLKPSNILLDENMNAKISDFGLARVFEQNIDEANTNRRVGTYGYMAPEYAMQGIFSFKSDVYSFGILVLEIVSGSKINCFHEIEGPLNLVEHAWELWRNDSALQLMDPTLQDSCINQQVQRCMHIALLCVENRAVDRPLIEDVILMLKSETMSLPVPKNPSFIARNFVQEVKKNTKEPSTKNDVTLSEIEGR